MAFNPDISCERKDRELLARPTFAINKSVTVVAIDTEGGVTDDPEQVRWAAFDFAFCQDGAPGQNGRIWLDWLVDVFMIKYTLQPVSTVNGYCSMHYVYTRWAETRILPKSCSMAVSRPPNVGATRPLLFTCPTFLNGPSFTSSFG